MPRLDSRLRKLEKALKPPEPKDNRVTVIQKTGNTWRFIFRATPEEADAIEEENMARGEPPSCRYRYRHRLGEFAHGQPGDSTRNGHGGGGTSR